mmetsp:Transcript_13768/g.22733  ORF Transcript_13768/g.22733 Transcript_13768/m.22733 type:complete len:133 (-) Transcript_13768:1935-2333(-)
MTVTVALKSDMLTALTAATVTLYSAPRTMLTPSANLKVLASPPVLKRSSTPPETTLTMCVCTTAPPSQWEVHDSNTTPELPFTDALKPVGVSGARATIGTDEALLTALVVSMMPYPSTVSKDPLPFAVARRS